MFCPNCGAHNPDTSKFCVQCGGSFSQVPTGPQVVPPASPITYIQQPPQPTIYVQQPTVVYGFPTNIPPPRKMGFGEAIGHCFSNYVNFKGRASRSEYWFFYLFTSLIFWGGLFFTAGILTLIGFFVLTLPLLAAGTRRLHDINKSGAAYLIALIPFVGAILLVVWQASEGEPIPNRYGPPMVK